MTTLLGYGGQLPVHVAGIMFKVTNAGFWANEDGLNDSNWEIFSSTGEKVGSFGIVGYPGNHDFGGVYATKEDIERAFDLFNILWED